MADTKKYLDLVGLTYYDEKIKAYIKSNGSDVTDALIALIGAAEKGEDEATILARIADLEAAVGDVSELGDEVENLVKAILGENARATDVEDKLIALIGAAEKGEDEDDILTRIEALEDDTTDADAIEALEKKLYGDEEAEDEDAQKGDLVLLKESLDAVNNISDVVAGISVQVDETDGIVEKPVVVVADNAVTFTPESKGTDEDEPVGRDLEVTNEDAVLKGDAIAAIKGYVDDVAKAIDGNADELEDRVEDLEALHAKKTVGEGEDAKEVFKTVAEEVNEAVTDLIDGAPEALDTLKEIADWIANQDESGVTDAATLVARVDDNTKNIGDITSLDENLESDTLVEAINAVNEKVDAFERITETEIDELFNLEIEDAENGTF